MTNSETNPYPDVIHIPKNRKRKWNNHVRNQEGVRLGDWAADALDRAVDLAAYPDFLRNEIFDAEQGVSEYREGYAKGLQEALDAYEDRDVPLYPLCQSYNGGDHGFHS